MSEMLDQLKGQLVVSCQAYPGEPMRVPATMAQVAQAVVLGGAKAVRLQGLDDIRAAKKVLEVPVIGLVKDGKEGVYITPTLDFAVLAAAVGADIVAIDGTQRPRPDGRTFAETVAGLKERYPHVLVMADCDCIESARHAVKGGADILGTTLAGYTEARAKTEGPDLELVAEIVAEFPEYPVFAEGRVHTPEQARAAIDAGAHAVVVGTAITHPTTITGWFAAAVAG
ncbi:N-acetylmannosamine-6-phosphate 2-epimerase [Tessaracoccus sp. OH4464_COT-324]|uniref:N-acetylmannosamine-6-phosphate 2-epimerase n=1 Tax=Tessaracoccus sp. OH4464_COT-324 TaxID=2491059 RepID=UPI000F63FE43|nr:N-acetylmannosamine-6-phosphate 2-epimerase [Tessaracoccus sp. OH4464_COT-324]RRD46367.1 N-acetylmannosamine-6-phosphate 2-epimerase [Tessaracoccus sp. OH4464_COT-324]